MDSGARIKILIADDQVLFADNLKIMLETVAPDIEVVGIAYNGNQAVAMVDELSPDLVLMDVRMPELDGVNATRIIRESHPSQKIVMLTTFIDDTYVQTALNYGAVGYILKNIKHNELIASLRAVYQGSVLFSADLISKLIGKEDQADLDQESANVRDILNKLGRREKDIIKLMAKGYSNVEIAGELFISEPTVRNYISAIYAKLGSNKRLEVISLAQKAITKF